MLSNIPEGQEYDLCLTVGDDIDSVQEFCEEEMLLEETCFGDGETLEDGSKVMRYLVEPSCGLDDDTNVLIKVLAQESSTGSCQPYTITTWSVAAPESSNK